MILRNLDGAVDVLNTLDWTGNPELARRLQDSVHNSTNGGYCGPEVVSHEELGYIFLKSLFC